MPRINTPFGDDSKAIATRPQFSGSVRDRLAKKAEAPATVKDRVVLLQDCSTSMENIMDTRGRRSRLDVSKDCIRKFLDKCNPRISAIGLVSFSSMAHKLQIATTDYNKVAAQALTICSEAYTNMALGIRFALELDPTRLVLVSDGMPDSIEETLQQARICVERSVPIDCIYIGDTHESGASFMKQLAEMTGGFFFTVDDVEKFEKAILQLEAGARLMLTHKR
jgi:hypothetical protein